MKNRIFLILIVIFSTSCDKEYFIPARIIDAFPVDYYHMDDILKLSYQINDKTIDTISLIIDKNKIHIMFEHDYFTGAEYKIETYSFEAISPDRKQSISFYYSSRENNFEGNLRFNEKNFSLDIIDSFFDSVTINNVLYNNLFRLRSEYQDDTYAHISNEYGIINIVADSIKLIPLN